MTIADPASGPGISSDGAGAYINGQNGVSATIESCTGYYDAVIQVGGGSTGRTFHYNFAGAELAATTYTPGWATNGSAFSSQGFINVKNIANPNLCTNQNPACYNPGGDYTFTTYVYNGNLTGPTGSAFKLHYVSGDPPSNTGEACSMSCTDLNTPYSTSLVTVHHIPASTAGKETWVVSPTVNCVGTGCSADQYQGGVVGTLITTTTTRGTTTDHNAGQFSIPFQLTITRN